MVLPDLVTRLGLDIDFPLPSKPWLCPPHPERSGRSDDSEAWVDYGLWLRDQSKLGLAILAFSQALRREHDHTLAMFHLITTFWEFKGERALPELREKMEDPASLGFHLTSWIMGHLVRNDPQVPRVRPTAEEIERTGLEHSWEVGPAFLQRFLFPHGHQLAFNMDGEPVSFPRVELELVCDHRSIGEVRWKLFDVDQDTADHTLSHIGAEPVDGDLVEMVLILHPGLVSLLQPMDDLMGFLLQVHPDGGTILLDLFFFQLESAKGRGLLD